MSNRKAKPSKLALTRRRNATRRLKQRRSTPAGRLAEDGSTSKEAMRRRILALAYERKLPEKEFAKALTCQTFHVAEFAERHRLSFDWLYFGDLKGLLWMTNDRRARRVMTATSMETDS
ncbi:hypothetical protein V1283_003318 [Bradyrhizobium sp. AZCC 2262]|uniref:hypothetical protein n=1 Tax=Bradyrhizobium sp. AZCC 2262 TaxID=3117022 RepID=UPI002FF24526